MKSFDALLEIVERKARFDTSNVWFDSSETYLNALKEEVDEVMAEIPQKRVCYLEDELADILWDYLSALKALEKETGISTSSVIDRACKKFDERITGIEQGKRWSDIKQKQKLELAEEWQKRRI